LDFTRAAGTEPRNDEASILKRSTMAFVLELWAFMRARQKFWMLPIILMTAIFGGLLVLSKGSVIAPFIYTLF
jgi:hypothetical protein